MRALLARSIRPGRLHKGRQPVVWLVALVTGVVVGYAAIGFLLLIRIAQFLAFGAGRSGLSSWAAGLPWWHVVLAPTLGGLAVGLFLHWVMKGMRPLGVADLIEARALHGGRVPFGQAAASALVSATSLGVGGSGGREGPMVHLGGALAARATAWLGYPPRLARTLLGCGVAAAVSASFNAPLAGVLFALEVVLGHYALRAFAPITIASIAGATVSRLHLGDRPAFVLPEAPLASYWEAPAFVLLGFVTAVVAVIFMRGIAAAEGRATALPLPDWLRPAAGGLLIGLIALGFPQVLGVGYEATDMALKQQFPLLMLLALIVAKLLATAITLASRFGGGVFSPSLYLGAMTGGAFGLLLAAAVPGATSGSGFYAMVGMGALSAAVLGAPISTTLIVFELTRDYAITFALLVSASIATVFTQSNLGASFFQLQLLGRDLDLRFGPHKSLLQTLKVHHFMVNLDGPACRTDDARRFLYPDTSLGQALELMDAGGVDELPVVRRGQEDEIVAFAGYQAALQLYNRHLVETAMEEHR